jgi:hypothetical protein
VGEIVEQGKYSSDCCLPMSGRPLGLPRVSLPFASVLQLLNPLCTAREIQMRRGETGPLSPDHLREAYRAYQQETGRVGAAQPLRAKMLFVR